MANFDISILAIGDLHFQNSNLEDSKKYVEKSLKIIKEKSPDYVILLGDILHHHETAKQQPFNLACDYIVEISKITPVYVIIGNHDLISANQFLTDKHFFNPLKKFKNVYVVDKPLIIEDGDYSFVCCPYVPPGKFKKALDTLVTENKFLWDIQADCIFAHQEFYGCKMGAIISEKGDKWDDIYPPVISGHIHEAQTLDNIYYTGSAMQHAFAGDSKKRMWFIRFSEEYDNKFEVDKIDVGIKGRKIVRMDIKNIDKLDKKIINKFHTKLSLKGTSADFKLFRKSKKYEELENLGFKFSFVPEVHEVETDKISSYNEILEKLIDERKNPIINKIYDEIK